MPTPRHPRHPPATLSLSAYHPRPHPSSPAYSTRSPRSTSSPYSTATYAPHHTLPPPLHTLLLYMHLAPTSCRTSSPCPQQHSPPFRTASHPSSARTHPVLSISQLSFYTPSHPFPVYPSPLFRGKVCTSPPKASSNPPVEIFYSKRRRRLILNILPRRHRVDNSVSSSVHSEEKA